MLDAIIGKNSTNAAKVALPVIFGRKQLCMRTGWVAIHCLLVCTVVWGAASQDNKTKRPTCTLATTTVDGVVVDYALYPLPHYAAGWSQWGKGVVASNGKVYSAVGDHKGVEGNSFVYEYDPDRRTLRMVADLQTAVPLEPGQYGFGKVHGRLSEGRDGMVYFASFYGTHKPEHVSVSHHFFKYNPYTGTIEDLGAVRGFGVPSTGMWPEGLLLYGEAVDIAAEKVQFIVFDVTRRQVIYRGPHPFLYARAVFVDSEGHAYFNDGNCALKKFDPRNMTLHDMPYALPEAELRQTTGPGPRGYLYGLTQVSHVLFRFDPSSGVITRICSVEGDTAGLELDPTGRYIYYVSKKNSADGATPLYQVDVSDPLEPRKRAICDVVPQVEGALGRSYDMSFNMTVSRNGREIYLGFNAGSSVAFVVVHVPDDGETAFPGSNPTPALRFSASPDISPPVSRQGQEQRITARAVGDLNGDGYLDIVLGSREGIRLCLWDPKEGCFQDGASDMAGRPQGTVVDIAIVDLDNDGDADLAVLEGGASDGNIGALKIMLQDRATDSGPSSSWRVRSCKSEVLADQIVPLDCSGDGLVDLCLFTTSASGGRGMQILCNIGDGRFSDVSEEAGIRDDCLVSAGVVGDFDGDTWPDVYLPRIGTILFGDRHERYGESRCASVALGPSDLVCVEDIDGDGDLDLLVAGPGEPQDEQRDRSAALVLYRNVATNEESSTVWDSDPTTVARLSFMPACLQVVDLDNDGLRDILVGCTRGTNGKHVPCILANTSTEAGELRFRVSSDDGDDLGVLRWALAADHNRDGKQDIWCLDETASCGFTVLENTGAGDHGITATFGPQTTFAGPGGIGSVIRFYEPGGAGDPERLLGIRHAPAKSAGGLSLPAEVSLAAPGQAFVDVEVASACDGRAFVSSVVPVGGAVTISSSGAYPMQAALESVSAYRQLASWKGQALTDVKSRFLKIAGADWREPKMKAFLQRLMAVDQLAEQLARRMDQLADASMRQLLGGTPAQFSVADTETFGVIRYFLGLYQQEFAEGLVPPDLPQEDMEVLREYYARNLQAIGQYIDHHGKTPAITSQGLAGSVQLALVLPFLHVPDEAWSTESTTALPQWVRTTEAMKMAEQCALSCGRYRTGYVLACGRKDANPRQEDGNASYVEYLRQTAAARLDIGDLAGAITVLQTAVAEARKLPHGELLGDLAFSLCKACVRAKRFNVAAGQCKAFLGQFPASARWGEAATLRLRALYGAESFEELIAEAQSYSTDSRCKSHQPAIMYLSWVALRRAGRQADAGRASEQFLREFPSHALAADLHFAEALEAMAAGDYEEALRLLEIVELRFPQSRVAERAGEIKARLEKTPSGRR